MINKCLLTGGKFMSQLNLKQPVPTNSVCWKFTEHSEKIQKFRETGNLNHLYRNELNKVCFAHYAAYSDVKIYLRELFQIIF